MALVLLSMGSANAQGRTFGVVEATADSRSAALGNTSLGLVESFHLYSNPASFIYGNKQMAVDFAADLQTATPYGTPMQYTIGAGYKLGDKRAIYLGGRYMGGLTIPLLGGQEGVGTLKPHDWTIDLGYAFSVTRAFVVHGTATYAESFVGAQARALLFSVGANYGSAIDLGDTPSFLQFGIRWMDAGTPVKYDDRGIAHALPTSVVLGGEWELALTEEHHLSWALSGRYFTAKGARTLLAGTGLEYNYRDVLKARAGYQYGQHGQSRATLGLGAKWQGIHLDAAYQIALAEPRINALLLGIGYSF